MSVGETFGVFLDSDPFTTALPLPTLTDDRLAIVRAGVAYYVSALDLVGASAVFPSCVYVVAGEGGTSIAAEAQGAFQLEPAAALAAYEVVLPPSPLNTQVFTIGSTEDIAALTVSAPGAETVINPTPGVLAANGSLSYRYRTSNTTWYSI